MTGGYYKIGIHSGDMEALRSRYITSDPNHELITHHTYNDKKDALRIEKYLHRKFKNMRLTNINGNLSEHFELADSDVEWVMMYLECVDDQNNFNNMKLSAINIQDWYNTNQLINPSYQRAVDVDRLSDIKQYILSSYDNPSFHLPEIVVNKRNGKHHIIDGQHRVASILSMTHEEIKQTDGFYIRCVIKHGLSIDEEKNLFKSINKSVPCPNIYMCDDTELKITSSIRSFLNTEYKHQVSPSTRCHSPNINIDHMLSEFIKPEWLKSWYNDRLVQNPTDIINEIKSFNTTVQTRLCSENGFIVYKKFCPGKGCSIETFDKKKNKINEKAKRSGNTACYLGLVSTENIAKYMFKHSLFN